MREQEVRSVVVGVRDWQGRAIPHHVDPPTRTLTTVTCELGFEIVDRATLALQLAPALSAGPVLEEALVIELDGRALASDEVAVDHRNVGSVVMVRGDAWAANDAKGGGPDALRRLAFRTDGIVSARSLTGDPGPRNLEARWEWVLLEAARAQGSFDTATLREVESFLDDPVSWSGAHGGISAPPT